MSHSIESARAQLDILDRAFPPAKGGDRPGDDQKGILEDIDLQEKYRVGTFLKSVKSLGGDLNVIQNAAGFNPRQRLKEFIAELRAAEQNF